MDNYRDHKGDGQRQGHLQKVTIHQPAVDDDYCGNRHPAGYDSGSRRVCTGAGPDTVRAIISLPLRTIIQILYFKRIFYFAMVFVPLYRRNSPHQSCFSADYEIQWYKLKLYNTLKIRRILISQPTPASDKSPFSELTAKHKIEIDYQPFITVEGVSLKEFRKQRVEISDFTAVIFTSRTTIDHFFRLCDESRFNVPETMKYFCVTEAIALYLQKYIVYRKRKIFFGTGTFFTLMDVVMKHKEEKYIVPLSNPHKPEIPVTLSKAGINHTIAILSNTVPSDLKDINPEEYDIIALYSPADINSFQTNFPGTNCKFKIATFGNSTARTALEAGLAVDIMAPTPELPSMVTALDKFITCYNAGNCVENFSLKTMPEAPAQYSKLNNRSSKPRKTAIGDTRTKSAR